MIEVGDIVVTLPSSRWSQGYTHGMLAIVESEGHMDKQVSILFLAPKAPVVPDLAKYCMADSIMAVDSLSCPIPPRSRCADCDKPIMELDYLCKDCQP